MDILSVTSEIGREVVRLTTEAEAAAPLFQVNLFQVIIAAANFLLFLAIIWTFAFKPVSKMLARPQGPDRAGPQGRGAGPARSRERRG